MLAACRDEIDIVYISTPHAFHGEQAQPSPKPGFDLFLEKPMVTTVAEAERLIAAQKKAASPCCHAFQWRSFAAGDRYAQARTRRRVRRT
jgi:predicted dehydrogenase